ncbi:MAG: 6-aminohexanoate-dimer hydrolase [Bacilli bacterium]|nr:6-aminohexanoate-dimer hydrolase [Bacilli bacterium]
MSAVLYFKKVFAVEKTGYWPITEWKTSSPEAEGVDSVGLTSAVSALQGKNVHSFLIIRNGYIIAEGYNENNDQSTKQDILSATKSVTSALVGIAINQHKIGDVEEPIANYFPELLKDPDARKKEITVSNLLTMTSGLEWNNVNEAATNNMINSQDWIQYLLGLPLSADPRTQFVYSNGGPHLLSAILQKATNETEAAYAQKVLFQPIGIQDVTWDADPQGVSIGSFGLHITTRDIAKFGYLYLNEGEWDGDRVVPKDWITESTQRTIEFQDRNIHPSEEAYGYLWWLHASEDTNNKNSELSTIYSANGSGGQSVIVMPKQNMVVVITANNNDSFFADPIIESKVIPAIKSNKTLPANPKGDNVLKMKLQTFKEEKDTL